MVPSNEQTALQNGVSRVVKPTATTAAATTANRSKIKNNMTTITRKTWGRWRQPGRQHQHQDDEEEEDDNQDDQDDNNNNNDDDNDHDIHNNNNKKKNKNKNNNKNN